eukprot:1195684-Pyramimonas_sp.AAC.1
MRQICQALTSKIHCCGGWGRLPTIHRRHRDRHSLDLSRGALWPALLGESSRDNEGLPSGPRWQRRRKGSGI